MGRIVGGLVGNLIDRFKPRTVQASYVPASSQSNPRAQNYRPPASSQVIQTAQNFRPAQSSATNPQAQNYRPPVPTPTYNAPTNIVQAAPSGGGGNSGQSNQSSSNQDSGAPQEAYPDAPSIDYDAIFQPAFDALAQAESAANESSQADLASIDADATSRKANIATGKTSAQNQLASKRASTVSTGEQAINESRQAAAELQQGLAARYGAGASTGLGAGAIVGASAARTIGAQRASLTQALSEIETAKVGIEEAFNNANKEVDAQTQTLKAQARANLQTNLARIGQSKGLLQSQKARKVMDAMESYRQEVNAVNQRNTAFKQTLYTQKIDADNKWKQIQAETSNRVNALKGYEFGTTDFGGLYRGNKDTGQVNFINPTDPTTFSTQGATTNTGVGVGGIDPETDNILKNLPN